MKAIVFLALLTACQYEPGLGANAGDAMPSDDDAPPPPDTTGPVSVAPCSAPDPTGLVLCLEMEDGVGDGTLLDSAPGHHDAIAQNLTAAMRTVPTMSPAAAIHPDTVVRVAEDPALDRDDGYTLAMWVRPTTLPEIGTVYGLLDHEQQFAMLIGRSAGGALQNRCVHTGVARFEWTEQLPENTWTFLACTWDGTSFCAYRWTAPGDSEEFCHQPELRPAATGAEGLAIGHLSENGAPHSRFDGALDSVQIYDHGLTETQLCAIVGDGPACMGAPR